MMLRHYTYRQFLRRPGRTLLTLGGIVIGVAGVFAIALSVNTTRHAYQRMFADLDRSSRARSRCRRRRRIRRPRRRRRCHRARRTFGASPWCKWSQGSSMVTVRSA